MIPSQILAAGNSPLTAQCIVGTGAVGIVPAGGTQATATQLPASQNLLAAAAAGGVKLPPCEAGAEIWIRNDSGNNQTIYTFEAAGVIIGAAGNSVICPNAKTAILKAVSSTNWMPMVSA